VPTGCKDGVHRLLAYLEEPFAGRWSTRQRPFFSNNYLSRVHHDLQRKHNQERTNRAAEIIQDYKRRITGEDAAICLRDVLADLMHFAKSKHLSIEAEFVAACKYFDDEISGRE